MISLRDIADSITAFQFSADTTLFAWQSGSGKLHIFDASTWQQLATIDQPSNSAEFRFYTNGRVASTFGHHWLSELNLYQASSGNLLAHHSGTDGKLICALPDPQLQTLLALREDNRFVIKDCVTGFQSKTLSIPLPFNESVFDRPFHQGFEPDKIAWNGKFAAVIQNKHKVQIWDSAVDSVRATLEHTNEFSTVTFLANTEWIMTTNSREVQWHEPQGDRIGYVQVWDSRSFQLRCEFLAGYGYVREATVSPDGHRLLTLATGPGTPNLRLWDLDLAQEIKAFEGSAADCKHFAFSPDSRILVGGHRSRLQFWSADSGDVLRQFEIPNGEVTGVAFSPDGKILCVNSDSGELSFWNSESLDLIRVLTAMEGDEWLAYHPAMPYYNSSPRGDEYATVRLDDEPRSIYPLKYFRDQCLVTNGLVAAWSGSQPLLKPKPIRMRFEQWRDSGFLTDVALWAAVGGLISTTLAVGWRYRSKRREAQALQLRLVTQERDGRLASEAKAAELAEANRQLSAAKEAADAANRAKSEFLANMSHEIRTPMNAILGYAQLVQEDQRLPESLRPAIASIERGGDHLLGLINEILDLSKIESGRMQLQPADFDLGATVREVDAMFRERSSRKKLKFSCEWRLSGGVVGSTSLWVTGDEGKLRQVLINLLGNAVKFTDQGTVSLQITQELSPSRAPEAAEVYRFLVRDSGPGIPTELRDRLFQPFEQGSSGARKGGTGLGLAIARRLVELMGGEIGFETEIGLGSTFWFTIPLPSSTNPNERRDEGLSETHSRTSGSRLKAGYRVHALVVDDVAENREVLSQMLGSMGCEVTIAETGEAGVEQATTVQPDIIFMDIRMPGMGGVEAARRIRDITTPSFRQPRIVCLSASALAHEEAQYRDAGFDEFIAKPFRFARLRDCLKDLLNVELEASVPDTQGSAATDTQTENPQAVWDPSWPTELRDSMIASAERLSPSRLEGPLKELTARIPTEATARFATLARDLAGRGEFDRLLEILGPPGVGR